MRHVVCGKVAIPVGVSIHLTHADAQVYSDWLAGMQGVTLQCKDLVLLLPPKAIEGAHFSLHITQLCSCAAALSQARRACICLAFTCASQLHSCKHEDECQHGKCSACPTYFRNLVTSQGRRAPCASRRWRRCWPAAASPACACATGCAPGSASGNHASKTTSPLLLSGAWLRPAHGAASKCAVRSQLHAKTEAIKPES